MMRRRGFQRSVSMRRVRIEMAAATVFAIAAVITSIWPDWIEALTGTDPDNSSGSLEWAIVAVLGVIAVVVAVLSWVDFQVARRAVA